MDGAQRRPNLPLFPHEQAVTVHSWMSVALTVPVGFPLLVFFPGTGACPLDSAVFQRAVICVCCGQDTQRPQGCSLHVEVPCPLNTWTHEDQQQLL